MTLGALLKPTGAGGLRPRATPSVLRQIKNVENNPMQSKKVSLVSTPVTQKHFDTSGKSPALFQHPRTFGPLMAGRAAVGTIAGQNPTPE
jgi:hypothetical protein